MRKAKAKNFIFGLISHWVRASRFWGGEERAKSKRKRRKKKEEEKKIKVWNPYFWVLI